jgi:hypothetical protein
MAEDAWSRFRKRDEQRAEEERQRLRESMKQINPDAEISEGDTPDRMLVDLLAKCDGMMEQITNLYNMWIQGIEKLPPSTHRRHLEDLIIKIQASPKNTANMKFRISQFLARYGTFKDKWERIAKDVESGKIVVKRRGGPPGKP